MAKSVKNHATKPPAERSPNQALESLLIKLFERVGQFQRDSADYKLSCFRASLEVLQQFGVSAQQLGLSDSQAHQHLAPNLIQLSNFLENQLATIDYYDLASILLTVFRSDPDSTTGGSLREAIPRLAELITTAVRSIRNPATTKPAEAASKLAEASLVKELLDKNLKSQK